MPDLMSAWFVRTLREEPAEAEVPSHRLLLRAGLRPPGRRGGYAWLPLGLKVLRNVERIVRAEMDRIGAQEVLFPALLPREPYEATGRWAAYGADVFRVVDRRGADHLLAPTHEEMFALLAKAELASYKDLPLSLYQVQTKFRDEPRPRSGLLRTREFVMKDSYSFDLTDAGLAASYAAHREAYLRIFARLGLDVRVVSAVSGAMGGSESEEFLAPTPVGEDTFASCARCGYAANTEAVPSPRRTAPIAEPGPVEELDTPDTPTIETLAAHLGVPASATLKNLLVVAGRSGTPDGLRPLRGRGRRDRRAGRPRGRPAPGRGAARAGADLRGGRFRRPARAGPRVRRPAGPGRPRLPVRGRPAGLARHQLGDRRQPSPTRTPATWSPAATSPCPSTPTWSPWSTATRARAAAGR